MYYIVKIWRPYGRYGETGVIFDISIWGPNIDNI